MGKRTYIEDPSFSAAAYSVAGYPGIAWMVLGRELLQDFETGEECSGADLVCRMIGDDQHFVFDPDDLSPLEEGDFCWECGQIGCGHTKL